jgi:hypothetical protein
MDGQESEARCGRRGFLRAASATAVAAAGLAGAGGVAGQTDQGSIRVEDQSTDGTTITIAEASTQVDARLLVLANEREEDGDTLDYIDTSIPAGTSYSDRTIELERPIEESRPIRVEIRTPFSEGDQLVARDRATVVIGDEPLPEEFGVQLVEADPDAGFNYPYYLFRPAETRDGEVPIFVEPNNTGTATNDFAEHRRRAKETAEGGIGRQTAGELGVPLLVPVFPRPRGDPVDGTLYTHQLDQDTLELDGTDLERIDLQLLRMVEHAKTDVLGDSGYSFNDKLMLDGFSASGNFADRFTVLHADRVQSVTAGGLNGMALLPIEEAKGQTLNYHVGIADVPEITGSEVDLNALDAVDQLLYMGSEDENDTIGFSDAWTSDELEETALDVYGQDMITERFPFCQEAYNRAGVEAQFRIYEGVGHNPRPAKEDIVEFHRRSLEGGDVSEFGQEITQDVQFEVEPAEPTAGERVNFDASGSRAAANREIYTYTWTLGDGDTAAGARPTHTFDAAGDYEVTVEIVTSDGTTGSASRQVSVAPADGTDGSDGDGSGSDGDGSDGDGSDGGDGCNISGGDGEISLSDLARAANIFSSGGQC